MRGKHDHRRGLSFADPAQDVQTVDVGQEHVQQNQVEGLRFQNFQTVPGIMGASETYGVQLQIIVQKRAEFRVIVDKQNSDA